MDLFWIVLAVLVSSGMVFATSYFLLKQFFDHEQKKRLLELKMQNQSLITPIRLQAYERLVLFLERISPNSLIIRVYLPGMNAFQLQTTLIKNVREEWEHNLSQQVYISPTAWEYVKIAKEETIKMINIAASRIGENVSGTDLSTAILETSMQSQVQKTQQAIDYLKNDIRQLF